MLVVQEDRFGLFNNLGRSVQGVGVSDSFVLVDRRDSVSLAQHRCHGAGIATTVNHGNDEEGLIIGCVCNEVVANDLKPQRS
jgi:hypothetical protein